MSHILIAVASGRHLVKRLHEPVLRGARTSRGGARGDGDRPRRELSEDGLFSVHEEECLGACDAAPVVQIDFANHDRVG